MISAALFGGGALVLALIISPTYIAKTRVLVPSQNSGISNAIGALAQAGAVVPALSQVGGGKGIGEQLVGLLGSRIVLDPMVDRFQLQNRYEVKFRFKAREILQSNTQIRLAKEGFIDIDVEDHDAKVAADMANAYVDFLKSASDSVAIGEAANRRKFLENQLGKAKLDLDLATRNLAEGGAGADILNTVPEMMVGAQAQLMQKIVEADTRLKVLMATMTASNPVVLSAKTELDSLRQQVKNEPGVTIVANSNRKGTELYLKKLRDFKSAELMYEGVAKQYEIAKIDEAKAGYLIQVVDKADVPEWKSRPSRLGYLGGGVIFGLFVAVAFVAYSKFRESLFYARLLDLVNGGELAGGGNG